SSCVEQPALRPRGVRGVGAQEVPAEAEPAELHLQEAVPHEHQTESAEDSVVTAVAAVAAHPRTARRLKRSRCNKEYLYFAVLVSFYGSSISLVPNGVT